MNNRDQFPSFGMSPHERIEDFKRRFHENHPESRMFGMQHDRMSPFFERNFGNRQTPSPKGERNVPINVQHSQQKNANQPHPNSNIPPNQTKNESHTKSHHESDDDFYPPGFVPFSARDPEFFNFRKPEFFNRMRESSSDQKVHHIPIHVETRLNNPNQSHQQQETHPSQESVSSSPLSNNDPMTQQQSSGYFRNEMSPQISPTKRQTMQQYSTEKSQQSQQQNRQAALNGSQCEIPIQVIREESSKQNKAPQTSVEEATKKQEEGAPIPMPYAPLNTAKQSRDSTMDFPDEMKAQKKETPRESIDEILAKAKEYEAQVEDFKGSSNDKTYKYLDEMLTRCILMLDDICTEGNDELRKYRKAAINDINRIAVLLETKISTVKQIEVSSEPSLELSSDLTSESLPELSSGQNEGSALQSDEQTQEAVPDTIEENSDVDKNSEVTKECSTSDTKESNKNSGESKKEKPKRRYFFKKKPSQKKESTTDTNNNAVVGKETAV